MPTSSRKPALLASDGSCSVQADALAESLNRLCRHIRFATHREPIDLGGGFISPETYEWLRKKLQPLLARYGAIFIASDLPYYNNFFWDSDEEIIIFSFSNWSSLTNLPKNNGMVGFIDSVLAGTLENSFQHETNVGCVYDFLWDKTGVDSRLRNGALCRECNDRVRAAVEREPDRLLPFFGCTAREGFADLLGLLDEVAMASKRQVDVLERWNQRDGIEQGYDVFLCHNSDDKPSVRELFERLSARGVRPWFDEEHLRPGLPWQDELEKTIPRIRTAAVIVGANGRGPWQEMESRAFLKEFARRACPIIPVILRDAPAIPELPLFLQSFTWVDFRRERPDPMNQLLWGITGQKPR